MCLNNNLLYFTHFYLEIDDFISPSEMGSRGELGLSVNDLKTICSDKWLTDKVCRHKYNNCDSFKKIIIFYMTFLNSYQGITLREHFPIACPHFFYNAALKGECDNYIKALF